MRAAAAMRAVSRVVPRVAGPRRSPMSTETVTEMAKAMPRKYYEMSNIALLQMAVLGDQHAREERLIREIMAVDEVSWDEAIPRFEEISKVAKEGEFSLKLPYYMGIGTAYVAGFASIPLCFHLSSVSWFNTNFVTADVPEYSEWLSYSDMRVS